MDIYINGVNQRSVKSDTNREMQSVLFDQNLAGMIDHTLLKSDATRRDIKKLCAEAKQYKFASVCVNPSNVKL